MLSSISMLLMALVLVFLAAQAFTNALEYLGERLKVSEGVTGSIFAAVGTALPETIVPIVAIVAGGGEQDVNEEVGLGAILGAPFMLATLSLGMMGAFAAAKRGWRDALTPEPTGLKRDIFVFLISFALVTMAATFPSWPHTRLFVAMGLMVLYFLYVLHTIKASAALVEEGHGTEASRPLYVEKVLPDAPWVAVIQLLLALIVLILGARMFVNGAQQLSAFLGVSALVVSLLVVPVATELPEKVNSILWILGRKDTLAFGNITGAMVFQGTIIPAMGMMLMPWHLDDQFAMLAVALAFAGSAWVGLALWRGRLTPAWLTGNALLYLIFVISVVRGA